MAQLRFTFGTMGSGKSTQALQIHHNLRVESINILTTRPGSGNPARTLDFP